MTKYQIKSVKITEEHEGTLESAIARAIKINAEYNPSYGVQIEDESGEMVWDSEEVDAEKRSEIGEVVEASGVFDPTAVVDMCMIAFWEGRDWKEELARAKSVDAIEWQDWQD